MSSESRQGHETVLTTPGETEIRIERVFDADRELVWDCYTDPELMAEWLGPRRMTMRVERYDLRPGGEYRYVHSDEEGTEYVFFGRFSEVLRPRRLTCTFNYVMEPQPPPSIDRTEFERLDDGRTRLVTTSTFESKDLRDGMIQAGMEKGVREGYEKLDELLARRARPD